MARPQAFDQQQVLEQAMQLFWRQGYTSTSMRDLTEATRLQPGSLYGAFNNKRQLFLQSLDHYFSALRRDVNQVLFSDQAPLQRIHQFFESLLQQSQQDSDLKGCLLVNTLLEMPADDAEIKQRVSQMLLEVEQRLSQVLQQAQVSGELDSQRNADNLARLLMTGIFGLRVYHRMQPAREELQDIVSDLLSVLE